LTIWRWRAVFSRPVPDSRSVTSDKRKRADTNATGLDDHDCAIGECDRHVFEIRQDQRDLLLRVTLRPVPKKDYRRLSLVACCQEKSEVRIGGNQNSILGCGAGENASVVMVLDGVLAHMDGVMSG
jgi:hypothetical protein